MPAGVSKTLSIDLHVRVSAAIAAGLSQRQAGKRFGISVARVGRWRKLQRNQGDVQPAPLSSDRRSHALERHGATILGITLAGIRLPDILKHRPKRFESQPDLDPKCLVSIDET